MLEKLFNQFLKWVFSLLGVDFTPEEFRTFQAHDDLHSKLSLGVQIFGRRLAEARLEAALSRLRQQGTNTSDLLALYRKVRPPSLAWFLDRTDRGQGRIFFRVMAPGASTFYRDYASFEDIPKVIHDEKTGRSFSPDLKFIRVVATVSQGRSAYGASS